MNASKGYEQSRRDDMEAVGFMLAYFLRDGDLPWVGRHTKGLNKADKTKRIIELKEETDFEELFDVYSPEFVTYMKYCRAMPFEARPDYEYLRKLMAKVLERNEHDPESDDFDWLLKRE